jgi:hypothetical protein
LGWQAIFVSVCGAEPKAAVAATNKTVYTANPDLKTQLDIKRSFLLANSFSVMRLFNSIASAPLAPEQYAFSVVENTELALLLMLHSQFHAIRCKRCCSDQECEIGLRNRLVVNSAGNCLDGIVAIVCCEKANYSHAL